MIVVRNPRILIVDDELGPREALRMILRDEYDVVKAAGRPLNILMMANSVSDPGYKDAGH